MISMLAIFAFFFVVVCERRKKRMVLCFPSEFIIEKSKRERLEPSFSIKLRSWEQPLGIAEANEAGMEVDTEGKVARKEANIQRRAATASAAAVIC